MGSSKLLAWHQGNACPVCLGFGPSREVLATRKLQMVTNVKSIGELQAGAEQISSPQLLAFHIFSVSSSTQECSEPHLRYQPLTRVSTVGVKHR